jgi:tungstate transport system permease protein
MDYLIEGIRQALVLIFTGDPEIVTITLISLKVSTSAIVCSSVLSIPLGFIIGIYSFPGRSSIIVFLNTLMAFPAVVVGLMIYAMISNNGPLGPFGLLYTPTAMAMGQFVLAAPIITGLTISAIQSADPRIRSTATVLGAGPLQSAIAVVHEARFALAAAIVAGYGRIIGEIGASMILGGNIRGYTRNIPTAIAVETSKGEFSLALALGFILLTVALCINLFMRILQNK